MILYDASGTVIDSVTYGSWDDGNLNDNAPEGGSSSDNNECLSRFPNGVDSDVDGDDFFKISCTFNTTNELSNPIEIGVTSSSPSCLLESDNVSVSANIVGNINHVILTHNASGSWINITLPGNYEGNYIYVIDSSNLIGGSNIKWQFIVEDIFGFFTYGDIGESYVNSRTSLSISPNVPDGDNGWYVVEPMFTLSNPDAQVISYMWDGEGPFVYNGEFGLEDAPNDGNSSAGIVELTWWGNFDCEVEPESSETFHIDLFSPEIRNIFPEGLIFDDMPKISAVIDDKYQSNSKIDNESIIMKIDDVIVPHTISSSNTRMTEIEFVPSESLLSGEHTVFVSAADNSGRTSEKSWTFNISEIGVFNFNIYSPEESIFMVRRVPFNISVNKKVDEISYRNNNDRRPRFRRLCKNCDEYGFTKKRLKFLKDGINNLTIRVNDGGISKDKNVSLTIDSKKPKISKTLPRRGFDNGLFSVEFKEENPLDVTLHYGTTEDNRTASVNLDECVVKNRGKKICEINIDLTDFNGMDISYLFSVLDIAGNYVESRKRFVSVDIVNPIINNLSLDIQKRRVSFSFGVNDINFKVAEYIDHNDHRPRFRRLCSRLKEGVCRKRATFKYGSHDIDIYVRDKAGNFVVNNVLFDII